MNVFLCKFFSCIEFRSLFTLMRYPLIRLWIFIAEISSALTSPRNPWIPGFSLTQLFQNLLRLKLLWQQNLPSCVDHHFFVLPKSFHLTNQNQKWTFNSYVIVTSASLIIHPEMIHKLINKFMAHICWHTFAKYLKGKSLHAIKELIKHINVMPEWRLRFRVSILKLIKYCQPNNVLNYYLEKRSPQASLFIYLILRSLSPFISVHFCNFLRVPNKTNHICSINS